MQVDCGKVGVLGALVVGAEAVGAWLVGAGLVDERGGTDTGTREDGACELTGADEMGGATEIDGAFELTGAGVGEPPDLTEPDVQPATRTTVVTAASSTHRGRITCRSADRSSTASSPP